MRNRSRAHIDATEFRVNLIFCFVFVIVYDWPSVENAATVRALFDIKGYSVCSLLCIFASMKITWFIRYRGIASKLSRTQVRLESFAPFQLIEMHKSKNKSLFCVQFGVLLFQRNRAMFDCSVAERLHIITKFSIQLKANQFIQCVARCFCDGIGAWIEQPIEEEQKNVWIGSILLARNNQISRNK